MAPRSSRPWLLLLLALASGLLAAWLAVRYLRQQATPLLTTSLSSGKVVLAARDLPVGALVGQQDVKVVDWPGDAVPPGYLGTSEDVVGRGLITPMHQNEPFLDGKLAPKGAGGGLPMIIQDGMRALSVRVDEVIGVAGFVTPGTRFDILLTMNQPGSNEPVTHSILQNIQALAAGQSIQKDAEGKPQIVPVITVLVTPEQAETLTLAANQGRIQMALRNTLDTARTQTDGVHLTSLFGQTRPAPVRRTAGAAVSARVTTPRETQTIIEGFRGGEKTLTRFTTPSPDSTQ